MKIPVLKRVFLASALCTIFVLGTVILPLSHYGWMFLSGRFDHHKALAETHQSDAPLHADHGTMGMAEDVSVFGGSILDSANPEVIKCDYSTTVVLNPVVVPSLAFTGAVPPSSVQVEILRVVANVQAQNRLPWFRGPPIV